MLFHMRKNNGNGANICGEVPCMETGDFSVLACWDGMPSGRATYALSATPTVTCRWDVLLASRS